MTIYIQLLLSYIKTLAITIVYNVLNYQTGSCNYFYGNI